MKCIKAGAYPPPCRAWSSKRKSQCLLSLFMASAALLCQPQQAGAQCYTFLQGNQASVVLDIRNLPPPEVTNAPYETVYNYSLSSSTGNRVTVTVGSQTYSVTTFGEFTIQNTYSQVGLGSSIQIGISNLLGLDVSLTLYGLSGTVLQSGLPAVFPAASQWEYTFLGAAIPKGGVSEGTVTTVSSSCGSNGSSANNNWQADFDGDGKADYAVWRPSNGTRYVIPSLNSAVPLEQQWGLPGDVPVSGDYDGDGKTDYAVWRPSDGTWYVILSSNPSAPVTQQWGIPGDMPVPGDYDGDGKTDYAVWRPSEAVWYIILSSNPSAPVTQVWGWSDDIPVPGDYDGDGKSDYAVWRPSEGVWYVIPSSNPSAVVTQQWGLPGDIPVAGDYDGDGKTDYAVWRPTEGIWYTIPSASPLTPTFTQWGLPGDVPVPADYDGDGKTDLAVWRESAGAWYVIPSANPASPIFTLLGQPGDIPR